MQFSEIIGQEEVKKHLTELVQHNRLSHALLFLGKEGSGALPLALAFAQYVVCEKVQGKNNEIAGTLSLFGDPQPLRRSPESFGPTSNLSEGVGSPSNQPPTRLLRHLPFVPEIPATRSSGYSFFLSHRNKKTRRKTYCNGFYY